MRCPQCGLVHLESDQYCRRCSIDLRTGSPRPQEAFSTAVSAASPWQELLKTVRPWLNKAPSFRPAARPIEPPEPSPVPPAIPAEDPVRPWPGAPPAPEPVPIPPQHFFSPTPEPVSIPSKPAPVPTPSLALIRPRPAPVPFRPKEPAAPAGPTKIAKAGMILVAAFQPLSRFWQARRDQLRTLTCLQCSAPMRIERLPVHPAGGPIALILAGFIVFGLGFWAWPLWILSPLAAGLGIFYRRRGPTRWRCRSCGYLIPREG